MADELTVKDAAIYLGVSEETIRRYIKDKRVKGFKRGLWEWRVDAESLHQFAIANHFEVKDQGEGKQE